MKLIAVVLLLFNFSAFASASNHIRGYVTKRGAYVAPHRATNPDHSKLNNWSHKGNINPYTGRHGSKR